MFLRSSYKSSGRARLLTGLTLIEMLVVLAIFTILTAIVLGNLPAFRNRLALDLLAEEVAVTIRQAQVYGAATKGFGGTKFPSHGVHLVASTGNTKSESFILFADLVTDNKYDEGDGCGELNTECREKFTLRGGVEIKAIYICVDQYPCTAVQKKNAQTSDVLAVIFQRPRSDANFYDKDGNHFTAPPAYILIELYSNKAIDSRYIAIWTTGHIYTCRDFNKC